MITYELQNDGTAIRCKLCGLTSHNPNDVREKFCGHCNRFHEDQEVSALLNLITAIRCLRPDLGHVAVLRQAERILKELAPECVGVDPAWSSAQLPVPKQRM